MSRKSEHVKAWRRRTKNRIVESFGGSCCVCGYHKSYNALALHHLDPNEKEIGLGSIRGHPVSWDKIVVELRKCVLVCHNCHMEIHDERCETEVPFDAPRFDESYSDYSRLERDQYLQKYADLIECPVCGGEKQTYNKTCSYKCAAKLARKVDWDNIDLISLKEELGSFIAVGDYLDISDTAVRKRWKKINSL